MFRSSGGRRSKPQNRADAVGFHASRSSQGPTTKAGSGSTAASRRSRPGRTSSKESMSCAEARPARAKRCAPLDDVEPEGAGKRVEHGVGGADPACLEPLDVVDAHGGQRGHLFAPQSFDTPAAAGSEPDVLGLDPCAAVIWRNSPSSLLMLRLLQAAAPLIQG